MTDDELGHSGRGPSPPGERRDGISLPVELAAICIHTAPPSLLNHPSEQIERHGSRQITHHPLADSPLFLSRSYISLSWCWICIWLPPLSTLHFLYQPLQMSPPVSIYVSVALSLRCPASCCFTECSVVRVKPCACLIFGHLLFLTQTSYESVSRRQIRVFSRRPVCSKGKYLFCVLRLHVMSRRRRGLCAVCQTVRKHLRSNLQDLYKNV